MRNAIEDGKNNKFCQILPKGYTKILGLSNWNHDYCCFLCKVEYIHHAVFHG